MPLKVSSQGWVKVAPPPRPRKRPVDPEEQKESLCSPLRYFACQGIDPSRERLRMLGAREGFSSSQVNLIRPQSRLERSSTLDEWRWDTHQARSSSRLSGDFMENSSPPQHHGENQFESGQGQTGRARSNSEHSRSAQHAEGRSSRMSENNGSKASRDRDRQRVSSAPVVIPVSPPLSIYDDAESYAEDIVEVEIHPDNASVAYTESPSERHCRHKHRHRKDRKSPAVIPEEEEPEAEPLSATNSALGSSHSHSDVCTRRHIEDELPSASSTPAPPPPSIARSDTYRSRKTEVDIPSPIPESEPSVNLDTVSTSTKSEKSPRSERSDSPARTKRSDRSARSETSSRSSCSSHSSSYRSRRTESESSYTASERSASPVRSDHRRSRNHRRDYKDDDTESYYPSPPPSPRLSARRPDYKPRSSEVGSRTHRDRVATAPASTSYSKYQPAPSNSSWTSSSLSSGSSSRSSAPSINGYQLQAAIFQPKNYRGYRAPSLSKGNRWETATSALSFD